MSKSERPIADAQYVSAVYGGAVYSRDGMTGECYDGGEETEGRSPLLKHVETGERLFLRRVDLDPGSFDQAKFSQVELEEGDPSPVFEAKDLERAYFRRILDPPRTERILWPVDLIELPSQRRDACTLFVDHDYSAERLSLGRRRGDYAVVLPVPSFGRLESGASRLARLSPRSWKNPEVQSLAVQLADLLDRLNQDGYTYHDFHLSRMFFVDKDRLYLDYSNLICSCNHLLEGADAFLRLPRGHNYPVEFGDPAVVRELIPAVDMQSQHYSLCAFLFYLFFGRYPYDGSLLSGYLDDSPYNHDIKFRDYHRMPVFIFDPENRCNAIGAFEEDQEVLALWRDCPENLKELFVETLRRENAERTVPVDNPPPGEWLSRFYQLGWSM